MFCTLITLLVLFVFGYILRSIIKPCKFPPGPNWYPLIGCSGTVETMRKEHGSQWKALSALANKYSTQILGLKLGQELVVVVYGEKNVKQVFTGAEFEGRPDTFFVKLRCLGKRIGITFSDGPLWKIHRQFTVKQLRNVGFGKTEMEEEIQNEMINVLKYLEESCFKPINPKSTLAISVMNILWKFTAGEQIEKERLKHLIDLLNARSKAFSMAGGWLNQAPWSRYIFRTLSGYSLIATMNQQISDIIEEAINKHKTRAVKRNDFIYAFLAEIAENKETFTEEQLKTICLDLLIAGSQTTSNVLEFALLALLRNKTLQEKVHEEIDRIIGKDTPCWADSFRMIFTSAFLLEVQRYYTIVPLAGPRRVLEDTTIDGYYIPKDTTVLISVGDIHFSSELWTDPNDFRPERFIDERGELKNVEHLYPFGLGRRRCPGDALAKSFIFIVLIGIMQNFRIEGCNGLLPSDKPIIGLISAPKPYKAIFIPRH